MLAYYAFKEEEDKVNVSKLNNAKQVQDDVGWCWLLAPCIVMLNLVQHLTASLSCSCPRTDPETSSG